MLSLSKMWNMPPKGLEPACFIHGGYHTFAPMGLNPAKQFPDFKQPNRSGLTHQTCYTSHGMFTEPNSSPAAPAGAAVTCKTKKKRRRRHRNKKKTKAAPQEAPRQRHLSTTSEDSFIVFTDDTETITPPHSSDTETSDCDSGIPQKKVRFAANLCEVHPMVTWSFAYQAARRGPWEELARDRERFLKRCRRVEAVIGPVLGPAHRGRVFMQRFQE